MEKYTKSMIWNLFIIGMIFLVSIALVVAE